VSRPGGPRPSPWWNRKESSAAGGKGPRSPIADAQAMGSNIQHLGMALAVEQSYAKRGPGNQAQRIFVLEPPEARPNRKPRTNIWR